MNINIKEIDANAYFSMYGFESALADHYALRLRDNDGILSAFLGDEPVGYLIYSLSAKGVVKVDYIFTAERHRQKGVAARLLSAAESRLDSGTVLTAALSDKSERFGYLHGFLLKNGYGIGNKTHLFLCKKEDVPNIEKYMDKTGNRLLRWLTEVEGYRAVSLEEAGEDVISAIRSSESAGREVLRITPYLDGERDDFLPSMSFIALKGGSSVPVAHCIVTGPSASSLIFSQMLVDEAYRHTGVQLLPFMMAMRRVMEGVRERRYEHAAYAVVEDNSAALAVVNKLMKKITSSQTLQYNFIKKVSHGTTH
ncbi:MAG: GNAT family N-acetyltransferase [Chitinispirillia bacterium]|nr:GNAT family N-acetyltransferase [Chitinispirillia bacterium]MCL2267713.1 GNAT family N-acetyltransferase [Chitinispirillia bacterium]